MYLRPSFLLAKIFSNATTAGAAVIIAYGIAAFFGINLTDLIQSWIGNLIHPGSYPTIEANLTKQSAEFGMLVTFTGIVLCAIGEGMYCLAIIAENTLRRPPPTKPA
jgi:hypothetical protein